MVTHQVGTPREEQQDTLQEVLTLLEQPDTPLEDMDTQLEVMDTLLEVMDIQLEGMDTLQVAIPQDILLEEGTQDLLEVDIMDTTGKNKTPFMTIRGLLYVINSTLTIEFILLSSLWK